MNIDQAKQYIIDDEPYEDTIQQCRTYSEVIRKLVNIGTHVLESIRTNQISSHQKNGVIFAFFRRITEMLDAAAIQLEAGIVMPVMNDLRTIIEATLQVEYLFLDPKIIDKKVKYFLIMEIHNELIMYEKIKNLPRYWEGKLDVPAVIAELEGKLLDPYYDDIREEYTEAVTTITKGEKKRKTKLIKWYSVKSKINNFLDLTGALEKDDYYLLLYGPTSNVTHSSGLIKDAYKSVEGKFLIRQIRDKQALDIVVRPMIKVAMDAFDLVGKRLPSPDKGNYLLVRDEFRRRYNKFF